MRQILNLPVTVQDATCGEIHATLSLSPKLPRRDVLVLAKAVESGAFQQMFKEVSAQLATGVSVSDVRRRMGLIPE